MVFTLGAGASYFASEPGVPQHLDTEVKISGRAFSARLMWHPGHLIRVGLESGFTDLYSYSIESGKKRSVAVQAIPILLQWSMRITPRLEAYAGWGTYRLTSTLKYLGTSRSSSFSQGYVAA
ncbi:MAG: hypothetical protein M3R08_02430, partial [Bacteroidota bacterium]|nr:hypothetical protein [Bacteroidota bacterium]